MLKQDRLILTQDELQFHRDEFVKKNQEEFDKLLQSTVDGILQNNLVGPRKVSLIISHITGQRMSLHVADAFRVKGYKVTVDEKNSRVIIRW